MIDWDKLSPAPWNVVSEEGQASLHGLMPDKYPEDGVTVEHPPQSRREALETFFYTVFSGWISREDAEFIALLRNGTEVWRRRGWTPHWHGPLVWLECKDVGRGGVGPHDFHPGSFATWLEGRFWGDPFTAMIEADKWYKTNVEKKP